jgi:hypothetical protein
VFVTGPLAVTVAPPKPAPRASEMVPVIAGAELLWAIEVAGVAALTGPTSEPNGKSKASAALSVKRKRASFRNNESN